MHWNVMSGILNNAKVCYFSLTFPNFTGSELQPVFKLELKGALIVHISNPIN